MEKDLLETLLSPCNCTNKYTVEPHGDGFVILFGHCVHRHGANMGYLKEISPGFEKTIEARLNFEDEED